MQLANGKKRSKNKKNWNKIFECCWNFYCCCYYFHLTLSIKVSISILIFFGSKQSINGAVYLMLLLHSVEISPLLNWISLIVSYIFISLYSLIFGWNKFYLIFFVRCVMCVCVFFAILLLRLLWTLFYLGWEIDFVSISQ